jgi:basic membrane protein A
MTRAAALAALAGLVLVLGANGGVKLRVAYVTDAVAVTDHAAGQNAYDGFLRAARRLGVEGRVFQVAPNQDWRGTLALAAREKYDLIVGGAFIPPFAVVPVAKRFPESRFLIPDVVDGVLPHPPPNVTTYVLRVQEPAYLAGYLAALLEKDRPGRDVVSSVGGWPLPTVDDFIVGFEAGARKADPGIVTLRGYSHDFADRAKCEPLALSQIARGSGAVFDVAGVCGLGALEAAKEQRVWGVGVDADQSYLGPHVLTSVLKRVDVVIGLAIEAFVYGKLPRGGVTYVGLEEGAVGLGKISPRVPRSLVVRMEKVRALIVAGKLKVPAVTR